MSPTPDFGIPTISDYAVSVGGQPADFSPPVEAPPEGAIVFGPGYHDLGYDNPITLTDGQTLHLDVHERLGALPSLQVGRPE